MEVFKMANKNIEMLKIFFKVMGRDEDKTNLIIPNSYVKDVYSIDYKGLYMWYMSKVRFTNCLIKQQTQWDLFDVLLTLFASTFLRESGLQFSFLVVSLSGFDVRAMVAS